VWIGSRWEVECQTDIGEEKPHAEKQNDGYEKRRSFVGFKEHYSLFDLPRGTRK
jgi:hypothetical protein